MKEVYYAHPFSLTCVNAASTAGADGNVTDFAGIWSYTKETDKLRLWPDDDATLKVKGGLSECNSLRISQPNFNGIHLIAVCSPKTALCAIFHCRP